LTGAKLVVESGVGVDSWIDGLVANAVPATPVWVASHGLPLGSPTAEGPTAWPRRTAEGSSESWALGDARKY